MATWISNGQATGGSGPYVAGTQSIQYLHDTFAQAQDTIQINNGYYTWGTAGITITKGITLSGQTAGSVFITNNLNVNAITASCGTDFHITIQNINIYNTTASSSGFFMMVVSRTFNATNPYTVIIKNCVFNIAHSLQQVPPPPTDIGGAYVISFGSNGIIVSNCTFIGPGSGGLTGVYSTCRVYGYTQAWNYPDTIGANPTFNSNSTVQLGTGDVNSAVAVAGLNNSYIEDCTFYDATNTVLDMDDNTRMVFRYNTLVMANIGSHGQETSLYGVRQYEVYNNNFIVSLPGTVSTSQWTLTAGFTQPPIGQSVTVGLNTTNGLFVGQLVSFTNNPPNGTYYDIYQITAIAGGTITIQNMGWPTGTAAGTTMPVQDMHGAGGKSYNLFTSFTSFAYWVFLRGGTGVIHDNTMPDIQTATGGGFPSASVNITDEGLTRSINDNNGGNFFPLDSNATPNSGYPAPRQLGWGWSSTSSNYFLGYGQDVTNPQLLVGGVTPGQYAQDGTGAIINPVYFWNNNPSQGSFPTRFYAILTNTQYSNPYAPNISATTFILVNREFYVSGVTPPGYTPFQHPHPLLGSLPTFIEVTITGSVSSNPAQNPNVLNFERVYRPLTPVRF